MSYDNPWLYKNKIFDSEDIDNYYGYVYIITNMTNNMKYIGKKFFWSTKYKTIKKKRKRLKVESTWKEYYGSSDILNEIVKEIGKHNFKREILRLCKTKGECSYFEAKEQFQSDAVISEEYYNKWISVRVRQSHLKLD
jgi:hypothetical protein